MGVNRNTGGLELITLLKQRNMRLMGDAAHQEAVGGLLFGQQRQSQLVKILDQLRHLFRLGGFFVDRADHRDRGAFVMRIGVRQRSFQALAAKHNHETMSLAGLDDDLRRADLLDLACEQRAQFFAHVGLNPARAAVGDNAFGVQCAEVRARGDVSRLQVQTETKRFDDAATHLKFQWIIPKQRQMPGTAARSDTESDRRHPPLRGDFSERIEVGRHGRFERREKTLFAGGDVSQAVQHEENHFGFCLKGQFGIERVQVHVK